VEDLVIQAIYDGTNMKFYGPAKPAATGLKSQLEGAVTASVAVTPYTAAVPVTATGTNGMQVFAGPRDDPFFFDLKRFKEIIAGSATAFHAGTSEDPATDAFAGTNVMSIVIEVPKALLGSSSTINVWAESKSK